MFVLKYFKNIPRSPSHKATGPKCNFFFFKFATRSLAKKKGPIAHPRGDRGLSPVGGGDRVPTRMLPLLSFLYFLKIKISKIYVRFEIFQKYPPVAPYKTTGLKCNFFFFKFAMRSLEKKRPCRPPQRATGACRPPQGR